MEDIMDNIMDDIMEDITEDIMEDIVELVDGFNLEICGLQILDMYLIICVFEFNKTSPKKLFLRLDARAFLYKK